MDILIFDMDGVLLEAKGYHRALQKTVRLAGEHLSLRNVQLTQEQIHKFESYGISSEWHSSALCMAILKIEILSGAASPSLSLEELFSTLKQQPLEKPAIERSISAIKVICEKRGVDPKPIASIVSDSEDIEASLSMQWFQELVLGTESFQARYNKTGRFNTQSYLRMYDTPLLSPKYAEKINNWVKTNNGHAAIMTNRPSSGPGNYSGSPEAELGLDLVLLRIPMIGYGDISWLADSLQVEPGTLQKPNAAHALAAILGSLNMEKTKSLRQSLIDPSLWPRETSEVLEGGTITVIEDTPAGLASALNAGKVLNKAGIDIKVRPLGIATEKTKRAALEAQGAEVLGDINLALKRIEDLGAFSN